MWSEKRSPDGALLGLSYETPQVLYFYGTRHSSKEMLPQVFPQLTFCFLKQVHGRRIVEADPTLSPEADGQWTASPGLALAIQTADCLPLLVGGEGKVIAVHAGWRGVEAGIIKHIADFIKEPDLICIGPHIHTESFEVGLDVAERLQNSSNTTSKNFLSAHPNPEKKYVNLNGIAKAQIETSFQKSPRLLELELNTFTHPDLASYRRAGGTKERQYSFVAIRKLQN